MDDEVVWLGHKSLAHNARRFATEASLDEFVRMQSVLLQCYSMGFLRRPKFIGRNRRSHQALVAARLAALVGYIPEEQKPDWRRAQVIDEIRPAPPPLVGARSSTAPPQTRASHVRVKVPSV